MNIQPLLYKTEPITAVINLQHFLDSLLPVQLKQIYLIFFTKVRAHVTQLKTLQEVTVVQLVLQTKRSYVCISPQRNQPSECGGIKWNSWHSANTCTSVFVQTESLQIVEEFITSTNLI